MKTKKRILSAVLAGAVALSSFSLGALSSSADETLITNGGPYEGNATYISTYMRDAYYQQSAFEIQFQFTEVGTPAAPQEGEADLGYNDVFEFLVFDTSWGGWNRTPVGIEGYDKTTTPTITPNTTDIYTYQIPISAIESNLSTGGTPYGINLQTGAQLGTSKVKIVSLKYISGTYTQAEFTVTGSWTKGTASTMTVNPAGAATVNANEWNIEISAVDLSNWANPAVDVTVNYATIPEQHVQAEVLIGGTPFIDNYYQPTSTEPMTFTTSLPKDATSFTLCYDACTVTSIHVYDDNDGNVTKNVTGTTAAAVAADMGVAWNLGNQLESSNAEGVPSETAWGNPVISRDLIKAVKAAGFNTVRIPVSYLSRIGDGPDYTIEKNYLDRVKSVVDYAYNLGMYVIINVHNDGAPNVTGSWIDISTTDTTARATMVNKFGEVWKQIAAEFAGYDQKLVFEGFNELLISGNYSTSPDPAYTNINQLNQEFVTEVRGVEGNSDRVLMVAGYNTDIDLTVSSTGTVGFVKPTDSSVNRLMLSVHYYDPKAFALDENTNTTTWGTDDEKDYMEDQMIKIADFANILNMPVFLGEYGPVDKNNLTYRADYCYWLNYYAKDNGIATAYWDNGVVAANLYGSGLFDRTTNTITTNGQTIVTKILAGYNMTAVNPS